MPIITTIANGSVDKGFVGKVIDIMANAIILADIGDMGSITVVTAFATRNETSLRDCAFYG